MNILLLIYEVYEVGDVNLLLNFGKIKNGHVQESCWMDPRNQMITKIHITV